MAKQVDARSGGSSAGNSASGTKDIAGMMTAMGLCVFAIWFIYHIGMITFYDLKTKEDRESAGQYGDMFGGLNAVFSGLAFAGVLTGMWLQHKELAESRKDIAEQLRVANEQALAAAKANSLQSLSLKLLASERWCDFINQTRNREIQFIEHRFLDTFTTANLVSSEDLHGLRVLHKHAEDALTAFRGDNNNAWHPELATYIGALRRLVACEEHIAEAYFLTKSLKRELEELDDE